MSSGAISFFTSSIDQIGIGCTACRIGRVSVLDKIHAPTLISNEIEGPYISYLDYKQTRCKCDKASNRTFTAGRRVPGTVVSSGALYNSCTNAQRQFQNLSACWIRPGPGRLATRGDKPGVTSLDTCTFLWSRRPSIPKPYLAGTQRVYHPNPASFPLVFCCQLSKSVCCSEKRPPNLHMRTTCHHTTPTRKSNEYISHDRTGLKDGRTRFLSLRSEFCFQYDQPIYP